MRATPGARSLASSCRASIVKAICIGIALVACLARWLPGTTQAKVEKLRLTGGKAASKEELRGCDAAVAAGNDAFESFQATWASTSGNDRLIPNFAKVADKAEQRALGAFDAAVEQDESAGTCSPQRAALLSAMRKATWTEFLAQRQLSEAAASKALDARLFQLMKRRGGPLRTREKLEVLRQAVAAYRQQVGAQMPEWAAEQGDPEEAAAERRLGQQQFGIEDSAAGLWLRGQWEREQAKRLMNERAHGFSVSLEPALRLMVRPEGLGNLQVFSSGPVGPPGQPATVNVGVMNDGSIADVYREHPVPPLFSVQPAAKVNLNLR
mmetsp:Transcript_67060/g.196132  ORF Transcript_67060/g.196132 Transcript_67060/m.196132 type:complete len:324 (-) Transcript_67060:184-1155(-)